MRKVSGQTLVPVLVDGDEVVADSTRILEHLEERYPQRPLYPEDTAPRAEMQVFVDWFNRVWKVPPNAIAAELVKAKPNQKRLAGWSAELAGRLDLFERLLEDRGHLLGEDFSAADCVAFPFLKYAALPLPGRRRRALPPGAARPPAARRDASAPGELDPPRRRPAQSLT